LALTALTTNAQVVGGYGEKGKGPTFTFTLTALDFIEINHALMTCKLEDCPHGPEVLEKLRAQRDALVNTK
jgi:hypothetical protein